MDKLIILNMSIPRPLICREGRGIVSTSEDYRENQIQYHMISTKHWCLIGHVLPFSYKIPNIYRAMLITIALTELALCNNSKPYYWELCEMEIFHMLPESSVKFNTAHIYLVTGENTVNG